jgi:hypothetical protein
MIFKRHFPLYLLLFLIFFSVGCGCSPPLLFEKARQVLKGTPTPNPSPLFSEIKICSFVDDDGECIDASDQFPGGTDAVWIYFEYGGMKDGQTWRRVWEMNDETYYQDHWLEIEPERPVVALESLASSLQQPGSAVALRYDPAAHSMPIVPYGELIFDVARRYQVNPALVAAVRVASAGRGVPGAGSLRVKVTARWAGVIVALT